MSILTDLASLYERMAQAGEAPRRGFSVEKIGGEVVIAADGSLVRIASKLVQDGKKSVPANLAVPAAVKRSSGIAPNLLWDKTAYVLGVTAAKDAKSKPLLVEGAPQPTQEKRTAAEHEAFKALHLERLAGSEDEGLVALTKFLAGWKWEAFAAGGWPLELLDQNLVFRLEGEARYLHERPAALNLLESDQAAGEASALCLVTGRRAAPARLHPSIKGVMDAQSSGASLVSFNNASFESYSKKQGDNSPVSEAAAFAYGTALNALLARAEKGALGNNLRIGDATTVFWAETSSRAGDKAVEALMGASLSPSEEVPYDPMAKDSEDDSGESEMDAGNRLRAALESLAKGRAGAAPQFHPDTRVYVLGLAPNAARLSVRFWLPGSLGDFAAHVTRFWEDLRIEPSPWKSPPAAWSLLYETALQREAKNIPPLLGGELMRAVLTGGAYPRLLLSAVIGRIRADGEINGRRAAICKAYVKRNLDEGEDLMSLDRASKDVPYCLGRLFAAYAYAEQSYAKRQSTIRDKYLAGASANPARVFPLLMRGYEHNRSGLLKSPDKRKGAGVNADKAVSEILERLNVETGLPASLTLENQARFFVGFYHQFSSFFASPEKAAEAAAEDISSEDQEDEA